MTGYVNLKSLQKEVSKLHLSLRYVRDAEKPAPEDFSQLNKQIEIVREQINKYLPIEKSFTPIYAPTDFLKAMMKVSNE